MTPAGILSLILVPLLAIILAVGHWSFDWHPLCFWSDHHTLNANGPKQYLLSNDPLVVYIKDFITPEEASYLVQLA